MSGRAWAMRAISGRRQYAGNAGYNDDPDHAYRYDSCVPNHRNVGVGDLAVLHNPNGVLGIGLITSVTKMSGHKDRFRCPTCNTTALKKRQNLKPVYRCDQVGCCRFIGHEVKVS